MEGQANFKLKTIERNHTEKYRGSYITCKAVYYFEGRVPVKIHTVNTQELLLNKTNKPLAHQGYKE